MTFYLTLWHCIWKIWFCFGRDMQVQVRWLMLNFVNCLRELILKGQLDLEICSVSLWRQVWVDYVWCDFWWNLVSGSLANRRCLLRWTELIWVVFVLFVLFSVFPQMFWEFYFGKFSADHLVFFIVILDQVLVETCGSIGLEIFVGACPGCARGVVPPLSCVGLLRLPDRVVLQWFCIFLPLQWALEFSSLEFLLEFASYWSGFLLECSTYSVTIFPTVFLLYFAAVSGLVWWWPGWLLVLLLVS